MLHLGLFMNYNRFFIELVPHQDGSRYIDQNEAAVSSESFRGTVPVLSEYQHNPQSFRLPNLSPYDNFLKAAGC